MRRQRERLEGREEEDEISVKRHLGKVNNNNSDTILLK